MGGDAKVAGGCEFQSAAEAPAGNARDHRCGEIADGLTQIAQPGDKALGRGLVERRHFLDVGATDHALFALARDDERMDRIVLG